MTTQANAYDANANVPSGQRNSRWMRDVADELRQRILAGEVAPGTFLPTEQELMNEFQAPRSVMRGALDLLRSESLVERQRGAGTFNVSRKVAHRFERLRAVSAGQQRGTERMRGSVVSRDIIAATSFMGRNLAIATGEDCLRIEVLVEFDDAPTRSPPTTSLAASRTPNRPRGGGGRWRYLADLGASPNVAEVSIETTPTDAYATRSWHWSHPIQQLSQVA